jgi:hypothetical protein
VTGELKAAYSVVENKRDADGCKLGKKAFLSAHCKRMLFYLS